METLEGVEHGGSQDPTFAAVKEDGLSDGLVEEACQSRGKACLGEDSGQVGPLLLSLLEVGV